MRTLQKKRWELDFEDLKSQIKPNTKAIMVNSPHNPTGFTFSSEEANQLIEICAANNIILFFDEAYRYGEYSSDQQFSYFGDNSTHAHYDKILSLNVLSKAFGLGGLRIGWTVCQNADLKAKMDKFKDYTTICSSTPSEYLAELAVLNYKPIVGSNLNYVKQNKVLLSQIFEQFKEHLSWIEPESGPIGFAKLNDSCSVGSEVFCERVLNGCGVLLLPSTVYSFGDRYFRVGFGRKDTKLAVDAVTKFLEQNPQVFQK